MQKFLNGKVIVKVGDLTTETTDAIVNAANSSLLGGGGVDGAIHRVGGSAILDACRKIRKSQYSQGLPTGEAVATTAGNLSARYVIHTVGPIWHGGNSKEEKLLANCYRNSLKLADSMELQSIAFPSISCGVYGFPREKAAGIVAKVLRDEIPNLKHIALVYLVFFARSDYDVFIANSNSLI